MSERSAEMVRSADCGCGHRECPGLVTGSCPLPAGTTLPEKVRRDALQDARRAAVKAVLATTVSREAAQFEAPKCHKRACRESHAPDDLVGLVLKRAADEVNGALILEFNEDEARLDHQRDAWDEGYMHVMKHGTGRNTRGANPYLREDERG